MPARIPDDIRNAIARDLKTARLGRNAIARKHGVSVSTVSAIAKETGHTFDRSDTKIATQARIADAAAIRAQLAADLIADAQRLRERAWSPAQKVIMTSEGPETVTLPLPEARDVQALYVALGIALDKHLKVLDHDAAVGGEGTVKSLLDKLAEELLGRHGSGDIPPGDG